MTAFIALLRAVNVGGTGKLPMSALVRLWEDAGFTSVRTYIASGNVVFKSASTKAKVKARLEETLRACAGKPVGVMVRTAAEIVEVLVQNPFPKAAPNQTVAIFLDRPPPADTLKTISGQQDETVRANARSTSIYGDGMASPKLKIPAAKSGTARNMNTIAKLAELAATL